MCGCSEGENIHHHSFFGGRGGCCCSPRRFTTRTERINWLEDYKKNLEAEIKAVEEVIKELKTKIK